MGKPQKSKLIQCVSFTTVQVEVQQIIINEWSSTNLVSLKGIFRQIRPRPCTNKTYRQLKIATILGKLLKRTFCQKLYEGTSWEPDGSFRKLKTK